MFGHHRKKVVKDEFLDACRVVYQRQCFITDKLEEDLKLLKSHKEDLECFIQEWSALGVKR